MFPPDNPPYYAKPIYSYSKYPHNQINIQYSYIVTEQLQLHHSIVAFCEHGSLCRLTEGIYTLQLKTHCDVDIWHELLPELWDPHTSQIPRARAPVIKQHLSLSPACLSYMAWASHGCLIACRRTLKDLGQIEKSRMKHMTAEPKAFSGEGIWLWNKFLEVMNSESDHFQENSLL